MTERICKGENRKLCLVTEGTEKRKEKRKELIMPKATIVFSKVIQGSQNYGSFDKNDDYMVSEIHFTLEVNDEQYENMRVEIRQPCGTNYEEEPIEVGEIIGSYTGTWSHNSFAGLCEQYYRSQIGSMGHGINIQGASQVSMSGNIFVSEARFEMDIPEDGATSW
ncbi:MAG: hypothetical protein ACYST9_00025 [Planctomycetota bacterium]